MHPIAVSRSTLAHMLNLSEARVAQLIHTGVLPKAVKRGSYDVITSTRAYIAHLGEKHNDLQAQRTRWVRAKADKSELDLRVRAGELVEVRAVRKDAFKAARLVRDGLLSLPDRLAGIVSSEADQTKNHATLSKEIRQSLEALADTSIQGGLSE